VVRPSHAAIARVWVLGDAWVLRARTLRPGAVEAFLRETALIDSVRPRVPFCLPDPVLADTGERFVLTEDGLWTLHASIPGRILHPWQALFRAPRTDRLRLVGLLRDLHDATQGRLGPGDPHGIHRDLRERLDAVRERLSSRATDRLEAALSRVADLPGPVAAFVHGDFHWGNLLVDDARRVSGLIDLDDCRVSDPLEDLAYTAMMLIRDYDADRVRFAELGAILAAYRMDPGLGERFADWFALFAMFDVHLFAKARPFPGREDFLAFQVRMVEALACRPIPW